MKLNFTKTDEKVTREMAVQNELLFLPQNSQQSAYIQKRLFEMGFIWANGSSSLQHDAECVSNGIVVKNQRIYYLGMRMTRAATSFARWSSYHPNIKRRPRKNRCRRVTS